MLKQALTNFRNDSEFGLVLDWAFHRKNRWVSAYAPYLVEAIVNEFNPLVISSQLQYELHKKRLRYLFSFEPGFAAPRLKYDGKMDCIKCVLYSDPHYRSDERFKYFQQNGFDFVFSFYHAPFFLHFSRFPREKFVHFPWAVPDHLISEHPLTAQSTEVAIFGGSNSDAYDVRNWCREQSCVTNFKYSGVENKKLSDQEYYLWLRNFDAIVAAGSSDPIYGMVTPKYFEIASAGALLLGQQCDDLSILGFDHSNALIFRKEEFLKKVHHYKEDPDAFLAVRENGRRLVRERHKLSDRIATIRSTFEIAHGGSRSTADRIA